MLHPRPEFSQTPVPQGCDTYSKPVYEVPLKEEKQEEDEKQEQEQEEEGEIFCGQQKTILGSSRAHPARVADGDDDDVMMTRGSVRAARRSKVVPGVHYFSKAPRRHIGLARRLPDGSFESIYPRRSKRLSARRLPAPVQAPAESVFDPTPSADSNKKSLGEFFGKVVRKATPPVSVPRFWRANQMRGVVFTRIEEPLDPLGYETIELGMRSLNYEQDEFNDEYVSGAIWTRLMEECGSSRAAKDR